MKKALKILGIYLLLGLIAQFGSNLLTVIGLVVAIAATVEVVRGKV